MPPDKQRPLGICKLIFVSIKTLSVSQSIARRENDLLSCNKWWMWQNVDLAECGCGRMWKGAFVAQFELLSWHFSGSAEKNYENFQ